MLGAKLIVSPPLGFNWATAHRRELSPPSSVFWTVQTAGAKRTSNGSSRGRKKYLIRCSSTWPTLRERRNARTTKKAATSAHMVDSFHRQYFVATLFQSQGKSLGHGVRTRRRFIQQLWRLDSNTWAKNAIKNSSSQVIIQLDIVDCCGQMNKGIRMVTGG